MFCNCFFLVTNTEMANLIIYSASAGSGKTYTLVKEFLIRALQGNLKTNGNSTWSPYSFSHILCVTFTRKATAEMKERITRALYRLAINAPQADYLDELCEKLALPTSEVCIRARQCLEVILYNYSALSVFTIDSFIQKVFDSLVWELNLKPEQRETTNASALLAEAVQYLLEHLSTTSESSKAVYEWCEMHTHNALVQSGSWHIEKKLVSRGYQLFSDQYVLPINGEREAQFSLATFQSMQAQLLTEKRGLVDEIEKGWAQIMATLEQEGIEIYALKQGSSQRNGLVAMHTLIDKMHAEDGQPLKVSATILTWRASTEAWTKKGQDDLIPTLTTQILPKYQKLYKLILRYNTVILALRKLPELGLLNELRSALDTVEREKGMLLLADLAYILHGIAGENDASFIYERMGMWYQSLFIDEFQDTSRLHWELLKPFINNAIAEGGTGLLVGDVKQAIYRWRGGDWELLAHRIVEENNGWQKELRPLDTNYRSTKEVVIFNNVLLETLREEIKHKYIEGFSMLSKEADIADVQDRIDRYKHYIDEIYTVEQKFRSDTATGYVEFALYPTPQKSSQTKEVTNGFEEDTEGTTLEDSNEVQYTLELLKQFRATGAPLNQIAILVRTGHTAQRYADALKREGIEVISQDAFLLDKSQDVQIMLAALRIAISPENSGKHRESLDVILLAQYFEKLDYPVTERGVHWTAERHTAYSSNLERCVKWLRSMATLPLLDLFDNIAYGLHLPSVASEMPYFSSLRDRVYAFQKGGKSSTFEFLSAYDEEDASRRTIDAPTNEDAVNIMTIHKSKGLEFEVVICPEIDFSLFKSNNDATLWAENVGLDAKHPLLPHGNETSHFASYFARNLLEEYYLASVDTLNLLYVAFTRAKSQLYLVATEYETKSSSLSLKLATYLLPALKATFATLAPEQTNKVAEEQPTLYRYGTPPKFTTETNTVVSEQLQPRIYNAHDRFQHIQLSVRQALNDTPQSFSELISRGQAATLGTLLHNFMMTVNSIDDLGLLAEHLIRYKVCTDDSAEELIAMLSNAMQTPALAACYAPSREAWAEHEFVDKQGRIVRPDRVVFFEDRTVIIDFKFGSPQEQHAKQITHYKALLTNLGYPALQGILWYIDVGRNKCEIREC